jgi:putative hydrolase of the HAD superfamily
MAVRTVLVDLGGTLVDFFGHSNPVLMVPLALRSTADSLVKAGLPVPEAATQEERWSQQKRDPLDLMARPLEDRLSYIFDIDPRDQGTMELACRAFMHPLHSQARLFEDALPFLRELRDRHVRSVLVSNTTWGSPAHLWREVLVRLGLERYLDEAVFCRDVGWRKPDERIFTFALSMAAAEPSQCLFVGDDPVWDVDGPQKMGIPAVLLDRRLEWTGQRYDRVTSMTSPSKPCSGIVSMGWFGGLDFTS